MIQGEEDWFAARLGKVTASRIKDVVAKTKTGPSASRKNYAAELMLERITGQRKESFSNEAMRWGTETEPLARLAYSIHMGLDVEEVGFIDHPTVLRSGASPDGLVGERGMVELKCPNTATHCEWAIAGKVPPEHELQMQWQMDCCDRDWCDFVSYDPRMPEGQQLFVRRTNRLGYDDMMDLRKAVSDFDSEVEMLVAELQKVNWF